MISNPCRWQVTNRGDREVLFIHEGGPKLFHFSPGSEVHEMFDRWIPINVIFFAENKKHATEIVERMIKFRLKCFDEYKKKAGHVDPYHNREPAEVILAAKDKWIITEAPMDQFYKVGWASNDYIF